MQKNRKSAALIAALYIGLLAPLPIMADPIKLEEGTQVRIKLLDSVSSGRNHEGDSVSFRVVDDIMAPDGKTILVKAGTPAWGSISGLQEKGFIGEKGHVSLAVDGTKSIDGKRVPLRAAVSREGKGQLGTVIALSLIITPLFLFMHGKDATIPAGTAVNTYVDRDILVEVAPISTTPTASVTPTPASTTVPTTTAATSDSLNVSVKVLPTSTEATVAPTSVAAAADLTKSTEDPGNSEALDKLYQSGLLTKKEYETKKKALAKKSLASKK